MATTELSSTADSRSRVMAVVARVAPTYPFLAESLMERLAQHDNKNTQRLAEFARETEAMQAALVLGLCSTGQGNKIKHDNLDSYTAGAAIGERTGAIRKLYQGRES